MIEAGDKVVCVGRENSTCRYPDLHRLAEARRPPRNLRRGGVYLVTEVGPSPYCGALLQLAGLTSPYGFCVGVFRKIEAPRTEIAERIKQCKPIRENVT